MTSPILLVSYVAVVSDNDGSAFITKAEFDSLKNNFQAQIDNYNQSIDSKIDGAIAAYLAGIKIEQGGSFEFRWVAEFPESYVGIASAKYIDITTCKVVQYGDGSACVAGIGTLVFPESQINNNSNPIDLVGAWYSNVDGGTMNGTSWRNSKNMDDNFKWKISDPAQGCFIIPCFQNSALDGKAIALAWPKSASQYYRWICSGYDSSEFSKERRVNDHIGGYITSNPCVVSWHTQREMHAKFWEDAAGVQLICHYSNDIDFSNPIIVPILECVEGNGDIKISYYADADPNANPFWTRTSSMTNPLLLHTDATSWFTKLNKYTGAMDIIDSTETKVLTQAYSPSTMKSHQVSVGVGDFLVLVIKPAPNINTSALRKTNETVRLMFSANKI